MGDKVRCGASFRDTCNTIDKNDKKSVYILFSTKPNRRRRDFKRTISNNTSKKYIAGIKKLCFIYNEYQEYDSNAYNCGDLGKCCEQGARHKMFDKMDAFLQDPAANFLEAATSLYMKKGYEAQDFFKADIYYHNFCYLKFVLEKIEQTVNKNVELLEDDILEGFFGAKDKRHK